MSYVARRKSLAARARLEAIRHEDILSTSAITEVEIRYGLAKRPGVHALQAAMEGSGCTSCVYSKSAHSLRSCGATRSEPPPS